MNTNNQKGIIKSLVIILVFAVVVFVYVLYLQGQVKNVRDERIVLDKDFTKQLLSNCGLTIQHPVKDQKISTTTGIDIWAVLDNTKREALGCSWVAFEAQTGVVYVKDADGKDIATPAPLTTIEEWMTEKAVNYSTHVSILNNYTGPATITIEEENPSGERPSKVISIPIIIVE